jgi:hypothetical protein
MVCTIHWKHSHFCVGWAQSVQCAVMQHTTLGCRHVPHVDQHLPIEPTNRARRQLSCRLCYEKKRFSCQWNKPLDYNVSDLSWLCVIVCTHVQSKTPFSNPPMSCRTLCWPSNSRWLVTVLLQGNVELHLELFFTAFLMLVAAGGRAWQNCGNRW